jgi:DNA-binding transcriptional MerR regulator
MQMQKRKFRIGDLAKKLKVDKFVIRFWEKEFTLNSGRSDGGQRFYEEKDFETFQQIKTLLYEQKFTIAGAKKQLEDGLNNDNIIASQKTSIPYVHVTHDTLSTNNIHGIRGVKNAQNAHGIHSDSEPGQSLSSTENKLNSKLDNKIVKKMVDLRKNLIKLKELLN